MEISLGALFVVSMAILAFMATRMGSFSGLGDVVVLNVRFDDAAGLVDEAAVKIAGVEIGRVKSLDIDFDSAVAKLQVQASANVRKDALVGVKARSLLGEKFVEIQPISRDAPLAEDGDTLQARPPGLEIEELAGLLGPTIKELEVEEISQGAQRVLAMVERQEEPLTTLLQRADRLLSRAETVPFDDPKMYEDLKKAIENLRVTSDALPGLANDAQDTLAAAKRLTDTIEPTLTRVSEATEGLPEMVAELNTAVVRANRILETLEPQARRLEDLDYSMLRYLFRNEGLLIRMVEREVTRFEPGFEWDSPPRNFSPAEPEIPFEGFPGEDRSRDETGGPMSQTTNY